MKMDIFCNLFFLKVLMIIYTMKVIFLKCPILMFSIFWNVRNLKKDLVVNQKKK